MHDLNLEELLLGLNDLLDMRGEGLDKIDDGTYRNLATRQRDGIQGLPPELIGTPLKELVGAADQRHDGYGGALWFLGESIRRCPDSPEAAQKVAKFINTELVPTRKTLQAPLATEAAKAKQAEPKVEAKRADLEGVPTPDGKNVYVWASEMIGAGKELDRLLSQRADVRTTAGDRSRAGVLRGETLGILSDLRTHVRRALQGRPELPRDLDGQIFGYFDELQTLAEGRRVAAVRGGQTDG